MKNLIAFISVVLLLQSCKNETGGDTENSENTSKAAVKKTSIDLSKYPQGLQDVFAAHGGLEKWDEMKTLTFKLGEEVHTSDLDNRDILVENPKYQIGSKDGQVWIAQDSTAFPPARARFYHNLMFYFYAMPFILADDGIVYSDAPDLEKDGIRYKAIKVSYQTNIGDSPDDEYILYYHPETKEMSWLAYTVTYGKEERSDQFSYIKYDTWQEVNGLLLPKSLDWYQTENNLPTVSRGLPRVFEKVDIDGAAMDEDFYTMPDKGEEVE